MKKEKAMPRKIIWHLWRKPRKLWWEAKGVSAFFLREAEGEDGIWKDMVRALKKELSKYNDHGVFIEEGSREGASEERESGEGASREESSGGEASSDHEQK